MVLTVRSSFRLPVIGRGLCRRLMMIGWRVVYETVETGRTEK